MLKDCKRKQNFYPEKASKPGQNHVLEMFGKRKTTKDSYERKRTGELRVSMRKKQTQSFFSDVLLFRQGTEQFRILTTGP